ncbi:hypothetical protein [Trueperella pecoris]|uniref:hypothetical protein n=1 Tax=Trueperella pecoris TaxID=2733571 RepID=UPI00186BB119|nr:hypothetical protein [Trueperella pecoris]QOQ38518.1 hypothetical protein HLG82_02980 [Trueperella pecoris]
MSAASSIATPALAPAIPPVTTPRQASDSARHPRAESGNLIVLGLGLWVVVVSLILVLASAIHIHGVRRDLLNTADSLALELAQSISDDAYYSGSSLELKPEPPSAGTLLVDGGEVSFVVRVEGSSVVVDLTRNARLPFVPELLSAVDEVELTVTSTAELRRMP